MGFSPKLSSAPEEFLTLFRAGKEAARQGDRAKAHHLFRQAIELDPYHEQVWLWLASVVDGEDDRRVCFENVLELNPHNSTAQRQLQRLEEQAMTAARRPPQKPRAPARWRRRLLILVALGTAAAALGLLVMNVV